MTSFEIIELAPQDTAVVRDRVPLEGMPKFFGRAFAEVFHAVSAQGLKPTGPPFGFYPSPPGDTVEVEAGVAVSGPVSPAGEVVPGMLPGGRVAHGIHIGSYDDLHRTYAALQEWVGTQGVALGSAMWEVYMSDPAAEPDPASWRTEIFWPVT